MPYAHALTHRHVTFGLTLALAGTAGAAPRQLLADHVPAGAVLYVESNTVAPWLAAGLTHPVTAALLAHPLGKLALADATVTPEAALAFADALFGQPVLGALARLTGRGAAFGVAPLPTPGAEPSVFLILAGDDAEATEDTLGAVFDLLAARVGVDRGALDTPTALVDGAELFALGPELAVARIDADLIVARTVDDLRLACAARARRTPPLAADPRFLMARENVPAGAQLFAFADLGALSRQDANAKGNLLAVARQPGPHFLLGPALTYLSRADTLGAWVRLDGAELALTVAAFGVALGDGAATFPSDAPPPAPLAPRDDDTLHARVHRNLAALVTARAALFPAEAQPAFAKALADLTPLLSGLDLFDEVLPGTSPWLRLVARDVAFDPAAAPAIPLPALCLVAELTEPDVVGPALVAGFQSAISLTNVEAAQQGRAGFLLDLTQVDGRTITRAKLPRPRATSEDGTPAPVDARYNLAPACALVDGSFVIGTHHALVEDVVRELAAGTARDTTLPAWAAVDDVQVRGAPLARLVAANRDTLALRAMLEEGKPRARAEAELDAVAAALRAIDHARLRTSRPGGDLLLVQITTRIVE